ncbi:hypothetical protein SAMN05421858_5070 [Haladaptatus litoreus]|uniref:Uncharacterized protein n=1 Tax=Haladaptatus litoreus TaxID=553468 RepID=A0A1N7FHT5_9EURY|nr:hypothetical protein [Haladaptatus litoreus]SIR99844.1 hypothetical protein SAMN05421858_5070 [Haladaptatus litoreus]
MTQNNNIPTDEIESTFQEIKNIDDDTRFPSQVTEGYEGTHVHDPHYAVTSTYTVERHDHGEEFLSVYKRYDVDGEEVHAHHDTFELTDDGDHVEHSGESIEDFSRSNHFADPQIEMELCADNAN